MSTRIFIMFFAVALFLCPLSMPAHAQGTNCTGWVYCSWYTFWGGPQGGCQPQLPADAFNCQSGGDWTLACLYMTTNCIPPSTPKELGDCPTCGNGQGSGGGGPISLANGNTFIEETDARIPGLSGGLQLSRTWNSLWPSSQTSYLIGRFGPNWRSTYEESILVGGDHYLKYSRSNGSFWSFAYTTLLPNGGTAYAPVAPANVAATLTLDINSTYWTLTFQNGEQRIFNFTTGSLTSIIDRNGNTTTISYDSQNRPVTVTDPGGRHLYFGYLNNTSYLITSVTSDVGLSLSYAYDFQGRLSQVTKPDLTTITFAYDSNSHITSVTDSAGKVLESHTYDSQGHGLTSSRANGAEAVTVSYSGQ